MSEKENKTKQKGWPARFADAAEELQGKVKKDAAGYGYNYMTLGSLLSEARSIFSNHGLSFVQYIVWRDQGSFIYTALFEKSGGAPLCESETKIPPPSEREKNVFQAIGSGITYMRRYSLATLLGVQAEKDDDGLKAGGDSQSSKPAAGGFQKKSRYGGGASAPPPPPPEAYR